MKTTNIGATDRQNGAWIDSPIGMEGVERFFQRAGIDSRKLEAMASWSLLPAILRWNSLAWRNAKNGKNGGMERLRKWASVHWEIWMLWGNIRHS